MLHIITTRTMITSVTTATTTTTTTNNKKKENKLNHHKNKMVNIIIIIIKMKTEKYGKDEAFGILYDRMPPDFMKDLKKLQNFKYNTTYLHSPSCLYWL